MVKIDKQNMQNKISKIGENWKLVTQ